MILLDQLNSAENTLNDRIRSTAPTQAVNPWASQWVQADRDRLGQLGLLRTAINDPGWQDSIGRQADAVRTEAEGQVTNSHVAASGQRAADSSRSGTAGGGLDQMHQAKLDAQLAAAKAKAAQGAQELRDAGVAGMEEAFQGLLSNILGDQGEAAAMGQASSAYANGVDGINDVVLGAQKQYQANADQYRGLLSQAMGSAIQYGVQPFVNAGFTNADRSNAQSWANGGNQDNTWWRF